MSTKPYAATYAARKARNLELYGTVRSPEEKAIQDRYYDKNRAAIKEKERIKANARMNGQPVQTKQKHMLSASRVRAKADNLPHTISIDDIATPARCPILNIELCYENPRIQDNSPTLDKIIPELGYVPGNVVVISWRANRIKSDATVMELMAVAQFYQQLLSDNSDNA